MTEYLEGRLAAEDQRRFEAHLADCTGCTIYLEQLRQTIRLRHEPTRRICPLARGRRCSRLSVVEAGGSGWSMGLSAARELLGEQR